MGCHIPWTSWQSLSALGLVGTMRIHCFLLLVFFFLCPWRMADKSLHQLEYPEKPGDTGLKGNRRELVLHLRSQQEPIPWLGGLSWQPSESTRSPPTPPGNKDTLDRDAQVFTGSSRQLLGPISVLGSDMSCVEGILPALRKSLHTEKPDSYVERAHQQSSQAMSAGSWNSPRV